MKTRPTRTKLRGENLSACELPLGFNTPPPEPDPLPEPIKPMDWADFVEDVRSFKEFGAPSRESVTSYRSPEGGEAGAPTYTNEFWTARQRQASSLHEISYRACFKPQLPRFFIERLTRPGDVVYDPFMGRGTTLVESALLGRIPYGNDVNPLSLVLVKPRLHPPGLDAIQQRLDQIPLDDPADTPEDLLAFYHPKTLAGLGSLKKYFLTRVQDGTLDETDDWLRMVSLNRLTGHSPGFFSVYTLPPNQAVSVKSQLRINERRNQAPPERDIRSILLKKSRQLLGDVSPKARTTLTSTNHAARLFNRPADDTTGIPSNSISLVVTSPPFLKVVQYQQDNWLRCWFLNIDPASVRLTMDSNLPAWEASMNRVFRELARVLRPNGYVAFEVGEVDRGMIQLEKTVLSCGTRAGLTPLLVLINDQEFTKTANCWGVDNMKSGTNTNRIVVFRKAP